MVDYSEFDTPVQKITDGNETDPENDGDANGGQERSFNGHVSC